MEGSIARRSDVGEDGSWFGVLFGFEGSEGFGEDRYEEDPWAGEGEDWERWCLRMGRGQGQ